MFDIRNFDIRKYADRINIDQQLFMKVGASAFFLIACFNIGNLIQNWAHFNIWTILSMIASTTFNLFLAGFFYTMLRLTKPEKLEPTSQEEIAELIKSAE